MPDNEDEQQKIADCLSSIDTLIKATENKIDELKAHKKGLMQQLFPAEGKTVPQYRFPEFRNSNEWVYLKGDVSLLNKFLIKTTIQIFRYLQFHKNTELFREI